MSQHSSIYNVEYITRTKINTDLIL